MKKIKYHLDLGSTVDCMKRMTEATKGLGHRDVRGYTRFFSFFDS